MWQLVLACEMHLSSIPLLNRNQRGHVGQKHGDGGVMRGFFIIWKVWVAGKLVAQALGQKNRFASHNRMPYLCPATLVSH